MVFRVIQELVREQRQEEPWVEGFRVYRAPQLGEQKAVLAICRGLVRA